MTDRFKDAVKRCVEDAQLTTEEKELLRKLAVEEGINEIDAQVYITGELKKKINQKEAHNSITSNKPSDWGENIKKVGEVIVGVGGLVITVLTAMGKIGPKSGKK